MTTELDNFCIYKLKFQKLLKIPGKGMVPQAMGHAPSRRSNGGRRVFKYDLKYSCFHEQFRKVSKLYNLMY
jgi:hypothetical protein